MLKTEKSCNVYEDVISELVNRELKSSNVLTGSGFIPIGSVVRNGSGTVLVIDCIKDSKVIFSDNSQVLNGDFACMRLVQLSENVESYREEV